MERFDQALAVSLVVDARDDAHPRRLALFVTLTFLLGDLDDVGAGGEGDAIAVGRPDGGTTRRALALVSWRGSPPCKGRTNTWPRSLSRSETKAIEQLSGDQRGALSRCWPLVSGRGGLEPSNGASMSCER